ncbi:MAG TPA: single-stranded DNA-binding protein [Candidatus Paceibacterota bacterium]
MSVNKVILIGRCGKDPETRYMPSGEAVSSFSLAVGSQWKDKQGAKQESTEWVNVTAFAKLGEICGQYLTKGSQVFVSGRMKTEKYTDKEGVERYSTKIIADRMQMLGGKPEGSQPAQRQPSTRGGGASGFDDMDDDIPFFDTLGRVMWSVV